MPPPADKELAARITQVMEEMGGGHKFATTAGITSQTVYNAMRTGNSVTTLKAIAEHCPHVNMRWLLTGLGKAETDYLEPIHIADSSWLADPLVERVAFALSLDELATRAALGNILSAIIYPALARKRYPNGPPPEDDA